MRPVRVVWLATWFVSGVSTVPARAQQYDDCKFKRPVALNVAMSASEALRAKTGAGSLEVRGVQGLREARVTGTACASTSQLLGAIDVTVRREGGRVLVETEFPENWRGNEQSRIDLLIEVPVGVGVDIADGSGPMEVSGVGDLEVVDGSGELRISNISGSVTVEDGSGSVEITDVRGDVRVEDGSGEVTIRDAGGSVDVKDGSGSIDVRGVRGSFTVSADGSGDVEYRNVTGRVDVPARKRGRSD